MKVHLISGKVIEPSGIWLVPLSLCILHGELQNKFSNENFRIETFGSPLDIIVGEIGNRVTSSVYGDREKRNQLEQVFSDIEKHGEWKCPSDIEGFDISDMTSTGEIIPLSKLYPRSFGILGSKSYFRGLSIDQDEELMNEIERYNGILVLNPNEDLIALASGAKIHRISRKHIVYIESQ